MNLQLTNTLSQFTFSRNQALIGLSVFTFVILAILVLKKNAYDLKFIMPLFYNSLYFILSTIAFLYHSRFILSYFNGTEKDSIVQLDERYPLMIGITLSVILTAFLYFLILKRLDWKVRSIITLITVIPVIDFSNKIIADMIKLRLSIRLLNFLTELFFKQSLHIALYLILFILTVKTVSPALQSIELAAIFLLYLISAILMNIEWIYLKFFSNISIKVPLSNNLTPFYFCAVILFVILVVFMFISRSAKLIQEGNFHFALNGLIQLFLYPCLDLNSRYPLSYENIILCLIMQASCLISIFYGLINIVELAMRQGIQIKCLQYQLHRFTMNYKPVYKV